LEIINNEKQLATFHNCIEKIEMREKEKEFHPNLNIESNPIERFKVLQKVIFFFTIGNDLNN
jgi:hypothetical protein